VFSECYHRIWKTQDIYMVDSPTLKTLLIKNGFKFFILFLFFLLLLIISSSMILIIFGRDPMLINTINTECYINNRTDITELPFYVMVKLQVKFYVVSRSIEDYDITKYKYVPYEMIKNREVQYKYYASYMNIMKQTKGNFKCNYSKGHVYYDHLNNPFNDIFIIGSGVVLGICIVCFILLICIGAFIFVLINRYYTNHECIETPGISDDDE
jgi:hypothetical protein